ncbi:MAG: polyprenyl synthetase family protein [Myxococcota bacterium]
MSAPEPSMDDRLQRLKDSQLPRIAALMAEAARTHSPPGSSLVAMNDYHFETGGKRLRALLPLLVGELLGRDPEHALAFGAACEMLHNATLVHDDLQDGDERRRGRPTIWKAYGEARAINLGDAMFQYALLLLHQIDIPPEAREQLSKSMLEDTIAVIDGQEREFALKEEASPSMDAYFKMVEGKTSGLFGLVLGGAARVYGASELVVDALRSVGRELGVLFQIQDDVLDLFGDKGRGRVGEDVAEGKRSVMVVHAFGHLGADERTELQAIIDRPRDETSATDIARATALFEACGSKRFALDEIQRRRSAALQAASTTGDRNLIELAEYLAELFIAPIRDIDGGGGGGSGNLSRISPEDGQAFMQRILPDVSRTFALSIEALPQDLRDSVRTAYLLCRILDTVEDEAGLGWNRRSELFAQFEAALAHPERAAAFASAIEWTQDPENPEYELCRRSEAVFRSFGAAPEWVREAVTPHILEMSAGMREYAERLELEGRLQVRDEADLDRYCYFVAGTVGKLLTELFLRALPESDERLRLEAEARAVAFGQGLQLVNIIKDVATDSERGVSFLPADLAARHGLQPEQLVDPAHRSAALDVVTQVVHRAYGHLDRAIEYTMLWPTGPTGREIRFFCAVPLALALATMEEVQKSVDTVRAAQVPKVSRRTVSVLFEQARRAVGSDSALSQMLSKLRNRRHPLAV